MALLVACAQPDVSPAAPPVAANTPPAEPAVTPVRLDWSALQDPQACRGQRSALIDLRRIHPGLQDTALGLWMLCAGLNRDVQLASELAHRLADSSHALWRHTSGWLQWLIAPQPATPPVLPPTPVAPWLQKMVEQKLLAPARVTSMQDAALALLQATPDWSLWDAPRPALFAQLSRQARVSLVRAWWSAGAPRRAAAWLAAYWAWAGLSPPPDELEAWWRLDADALLLLARTFFAARQYALAAPIAEKALAAGADAAQALLVQGRAWARTGRWRQAAELWRDTESQWRARPQAVRLRYRQGLLAEDAGDWQKALGYYRDAAQMDAHADREEAVFRAGWLLFRRDRVAEAAAWWRKTLARVEDPVMRRRITFWERRAAGADPVTAVRAEGALSYYLWRADATAFRRVQWADPATAVRLPPDALATPVTLVNAGLAPLGLWHLGTRSAEFESPWRAFAFLRAAQKLGALRWSLGQFWQHYASWFDPQRQPLPRPVWELLYPTPFARQVTAFAHRMQVDPLLVWAVMREESLFDSAIESNAGAIGLLQLMPATADRLARRHGLPYNGADSLRDPAVNIGLGVVYLRDLQARYDGNLMYAIPAYNAGEAAVDRWLRREPTDPDVFVEEIPYAETRGYVVKVLRSYVRYRALYPELALPADHAGAATGG